MALSVSEVGVAASCLLTAAQGEPTFKDLPLGAKLTVLKAAAAVVEQMVSVKALTEALRKSIDRCDP